MTQLNNLPNCYIFDIDGTIALKTGDRGYFDWHRVFEDETNRDVLYLLNNLLLNWADNKNNFVIYVSGRDGYSEADTRRWLSKFTEVKDDSKHLLYMRKRQDMRKDTIVKKELYDKYIKGKYNVMGVFDDRNQVVEMWRALGLTVFQVAEGDF